MVVATPTLSVRPEASSQVVRWVWHLPWLTASEPWCSARPLLTICKRLVPPTAEGRVARHNGTIRANTPPEECPGGTGSGRYGFMSDSAGLPK